MQNKKWRLRGLSAESEQIMNLSQKHGIPPMVASILLKRGLESFDEFISPDLSKLHDPFLMKDMDKAVLRVLKAIENGETIAVYGDYDVDGITSTAVLTKFLRTQGAKNVIYYIPDRFQEGYGVNMDAIRCLASQGVKLLITVDCGITALQEVSHAQCLGVDVIITDHHECKESLPEAVAVLNPKRPDCDYPFKKLAGIGVVFKLLEAITLEMKFHIKALYDEYLDIVALGTIADVMPLIGENRIIVKNGLEQIVYTANKGLRALLKQADVDPHHITTGTVGYTLAPRINAAGRVGSPQMAVELLLSEEDKVAEEYAIKLDEENRKRQDMEQTIYDEAMTILREGEGFKEDSVLVLAKSGWHHGIIGIVASKITERFNKPCILISLDNGIGKGSGRSIKSFNLFAALSACEEQLIKFGGHELAAGLTVSEEQLKGFRRSINDYAKMHLTDEDFIPEIIVDAELPVAYMNLNTVEKFSVMAPYGMGNPAPMFFCRGLTVTSIRSLSEGKHVRLTLSDGRYVITAMGFSMGTLSEQLKLNDQVDIAFQLDFNIYRGEKRVQILLKDLRVI